MTIDQAPSSVVTFNSHLYRVTEEEGYFGEHPATLVCAAKEVIVEEAGAWVLERSASSIRKR